MSVLGTASNSCGDQSDIGEVKEESAQGYLGSSPAQFDGIPKNSRYERALGYAKKPTFTKLTNPFVLLSKINRHTKNFKSRESDTAEVFSLRTESASRSEISL